MRRFALAGPGATQRDANTIYEHCNPGHAREWTSLAQRPPLACATCQSVKSIVLRRASDYTGLAQRNKRVASNLLCLLRQY